MRVNAMTEKFEDVTVLGHLMIFTYLRVDRDAISNSMYMYVSHLQGKREIRRGQCQANTE